MHEISSYGVGSAELAAWREARHSTLLFAHHADNLHVTLLGDDHVLGRHSVPAAEFAEVLSRYARFWQAGAVDGHARERSFVTAFGGAGQGSDTPIVRPTGPKGWPLIGPANWLVHVQLGAFVRSAGE